PRVLSQVFVSWGDMRRMGTHPSVRWLIFSQENRVIEVKHDARIVGQEAALEKDSSITQIPINENRIEPFCALDITPTVPFFPGLANPMMRGSQGSGGERA